MFKHLLWLAILVALLRVPFASQAIGGDDPYYLAAAYHGLIDPLHPNHTTYIFQGREVTFQGYPHPPGNAAFLMALLALFGDVHERAFHLAYAAFSLIAVWAVYLLARRFSPAPFWAALLFAAVPAFVVNGNTLESDLPLLAFWSAGAAAFVCGVDRGSAKLLLVSACALAISGLIAMQSILFTPILLAYLWIARKRWRAAEVAVAATPIVALVAWQLFERATSGQFPFAVSAGYIQSEGFARVAVKLRNTAALSIHLCFMPFPLFVPIACATIWKRRREANVRFLLVWIVIFFAGACALFYAGSARYLLPLAAPLAIAASLAPLRWLRVAFLAQMTIAITLAVVNFQHWNAYRSFAQSLRAQTEPRRVWVDGEWGLRHYMEAEGALPYRRDQRIEDGDLVVRNELAAPAPIVHGGKLLVPVAEMDIHPAIPLRLIGLESSSGFSTDGEGLLPYDVRGGLIDRVQAFAVRTVKPKLSVLPMNAPEADAQIVEGIFPSEGQPWRWTGKRATILLNGLEHAGTVEAKVSVPETASARTITLAVEGGPRIVKTVAGPGAYTLDLSGVEAAANAPLVVTLEVDRTFHAAGDSRELGVVVSEVGLR